MEPIHLKQLKEETLRWMFSILGAVLAYIVVACIVHVIYHPDLEALKNAAADMLIEPGPVRPEPMEAILFRCAVIIIPVAVLGCYTFFSKWKLICKLSEKPFYLFISGLCIALIIALIYVDFTALNPFGVGNGDLPQNSRDHVAATNFDFYFEGIFLGNCFWLYTLIVVPLIACLFFVGIKKYNWDKKKTFKISSLVLTFALVAFGVFAIISMNTYYFPYSNENKLDFGAVYYSMTQVYAGLPMLVNHFTNTYGLYPQFLVPVFKITGLSVLKFSLVMSLLTALSFFLNFCFLRKVIINRIILFLGFATVLFFSYFDFMVTTIFDSIFSSFPIRYIIPSLLTWFAAVYFMKPANKVYWITSVVSAFFVLWNPEIGLVCYISWVTVNIYNDFYTTEGTINKQKIFLHFFAGIGILVAAGCMYELLIFLFYGTWPDLTLLFGTIFVFEKLGLGLLPMALVHPWNITAIILILGFAWPIVKWVKKEVTPKSTIVLLVALIGLGYFVYFQGRSHNSNFALSSGFCLILLTILGDELWTTVKNVNVFLLNALFIVFLFLISFSFAEIIFNTQKIIEIVYQEEDKNKDLEVEKIIENNTGFIVKNSQEHEKILILTQRRNQSLFFDGNERRSAFNPGLVDLFLKTDVTRLENLLIDSSYSVFTEPASNSRYPFLMRSMAILGSTYECTTANGTMALYEKRKGKIPVKDFFKKYQRLVFYRKYTDDKAGINSRINDEMGIDSVNVNPQFSLEIFFYSAPQCYAKATLIGNIRDSSGFSVGNVINSPKYYFGINTRAAIVPLPYNKWIYCVMNVFLDHVEVYVDGDLIVTHPLSQPMRRSPNKLYVGNLGMYEYFIGPISEIAITDGVLDSNQIRATANEIKSEMKR